MWDWIVVGAGVTGAAVSYELSRQGMKVLLLEPDPEVKGATRFGYGGLPYWSGTTDWMQHLCQVGIERHRQLSTELDYDTEFRDGTMLMLIPPDLDPQMVLTQHQHFGIPPVLWDAATTQAHEPLLNPAAHQGALVVPYGHIRPTAMANGFCQTLIRHGGERRHETVQHLLYEQGTVTGVVTDQATHRAGHTLICAGAWSRALLNQAGIPIPLYFTHAELLETDPWTETFSHFIQMVGTKRFELEANACRAEALPLWDEPGHEPTPPILDAGIFQMRDGSLRLGQISRVLTDPHADLTPWQGEQHLRQAIAHVVPALAHVPAQWHHCLVAFCQDALPLVGPIPGQRGIAVFSGFSNPLLLVPTLAKAFAAEMAGDPQSLLDPVRPQRFWA
ncbi:MAG: hypothetical protein OHK0012_01150 [Synechococcales cyanobacterium]